MDRARRLGQLRTVSLESDMEVAEWLRQIGLERYAEFFARHEISADVLPHLTAEDLKDAGVASVGDRRRLLVAARALRATSLDTPTPARGHQVPRVAAHAFWGRANPAFLCRLQAARSIGAL